MPLMLVEVHESASKVTPKRQGGRHSFRRGCQNNCPHHNGVFWGDRMLTLDKSAAFSEDARFLNAVATANSSTGENQYASPHGIRWRYQTLIWAGRQALKVPGDFIECGVYEGDMSWVLTEMIDLPSNGRRMFLYDTFAGFSRILSSTDDYPSTPNFFEHADADYRRSSIHQFVVNRFSGKPYVKVIKGIVPDVLHEVAPERVAFLHVDMNSAAPELAALEFLWDRISPGAPIIFDDYGWMMFRKLREFRRRVHVLPRRDNTGIADRPRTGNQALAVSFPLHCGARRQTRHQISVLSSV